MISTENSPRVRIDITTKASKRANKYRRISIVIKEVKAVKKNQEGKSKHNNNNDVRNPGKLGGIGNGGKTR